MVFNNEAESDERENRSVQENIKPEAVKVDDDNLEEKDLEKSFLFSGDKDKNKPVLEGTGTGGERFGQNNNTFAGNDKNNPSQYAGNTNPYFDRLEPSEEHPEDSNFKLKEQDGSPDYNKAQSNLSAVGEEPKPEKVERGNGENDRPHTEQPYQEGTVDSDDDNVAGYEELPDQQKVGESVSDEEFDEDHGEK